MHAEGRVGSSQAYAAGTLTEIALGGVGQVLTSDISGRYQESLRKGNVYYLSGAALAGTAYTGGAGGTPLFGVHNPAGSGKLLVLLAASIAQRATATAAGTTSYSVWSGISALPTGTVTAARNALSQQASGSWAVCFQNTAMTGSTALNFALGLYTHYWATAAGAFSAPGWFDCGGLVVAYPGTQFALGLTVIPTSVTVDASVYWEEITL